MNSINDRWIKYYIMIHIYIYICCCCCCCRWQAKLGTTGFHFGIVGTIALSFLFYPVTRGSSVLPLLGLTSEASIKYHIWLGHTVMILFTAHGFCFILKWAVTNHLKAVIQITVLKITFCHLPTCSMIIIIIFFFKKGNNQQKAKKKNHTFPKYFW